MINQPTSNLDFTDFFDSLNETQTQLSTENFQQAAKLSQTIHLSQQRWQVYLCALGMLGFTQWLKERAPDLSIHNESASIWQPAYANLLSAACNIQVGKLKICVLTASVLHDEHSIPFAVFDIPDLIAHLYVLIQVEEEQEQVALSGFLTYQQYLEYQQTSKLPIDKDWTYSLQQNWFNSNPNELLLNLRCLDAEEISLPVSIPTVERDIQAIKQKLINLRTSLQRQYIGELLTVKEGITLLSNPELVNWVYQLTTTGDIAQDITEPLINVGLWLRDRIDIVAQELGWMLMPIPQVSQLRIAQENFAQIRGALEQQEIYIPPTARGAYRNLECESGSWRLYAISWVLSATSDNPEWILLIALSSSSQEQTSQNLQLEVRDETQVLFSQSLQDSIQKGLYTQVVGNQGEKFWVTVTVDGEYVFEIPPFTLEEG